MNIDPPTLNKIIVINFKFGLVRIIILNKALKLSIITFALINDAI